MTNVTLLDIPSANQKVVGQDLMDELREVINAPKYDHMTSATVMGVLEMVKLHYWTQSMEDDK
jgi:predicted DNA-binding protein with PD1-like motif